VTTGEFRKEYERTTGKLVDDVAARYKAVVVADVGAAGVVTASHGRVLVLVYVDQQSASTLSAQPRLTQSRLEMTMVEHDGRWLVEKIRAF
jgi:Mce-associated membrane protein